MSVEELLNAAQHMVLTGLFSKWPSATGVFWPLDKHCLYTSHVTTAVINERLHTHTQIQLCTHLLFWSGPALARVVAIPKKIQPSPCLVAPSRVHLQPTLNTISLEGLGLEESGRTPGT